MSETLAEMLMPERRGPPPRVRCRYCGSDLHGVDCPSEWRALRAMTMRQSGVIDRLLERQLVCMKIDRHMSEDEQSRQLAREIGLKLDFPAGIPK